MPRVARGVVRARLRLVVVARGHIRRTEQGSRRTPSAFARGREERSLRVLIDSVSVADGPAYELLSEMAHHEAIDLYTLVAQPGAWHLQIGEPHMDGRKVFPVTATLGDQRWYGGGWYGPWIDWRAERTNDPEAARRDIMLGLAATAVGADALATRSPVLLDGKGAASQRGNPMTPREAAALIGLFLRSRDDFVYTLGEGFTGRYDRGLFYWIAARDRLPAAWRWFSACVATSIATGDESSLRIGESVIVRFDRVLRCRDRLHAQLQLRHTNNSLDEVLFNFDVALLKLSGAFDATAQIAHLTYLSGPSHKCWMASRRMAATTRSACARPYRPSGR